MEKINIMLKNCENMEQDEINYYINYAKKQILPTTNIKNIWITLEPNDCVSIEYEVENKGFHRIRRITGYLVGGMDRWNNAKASEERDRVKHLVS